MTRSERAIVQRFAYGESINRIAWDEYVKKTNNDNMVKCELNIEDIIRRYMTLARGKA